MTINFPFPLIKSNSLSDSVWHWYEPGRVCDCSTLRWVDSLSLQGEGQHSPATSPQEETLREGSLGV